MKRIIVGATEYTPELDLNPTDLTIMFKGVSRPENVGMFYQQVLDWVNNLLIEADLLNGKTIKLIFKLDYCNSPSQKYFIIFIDKIIQLKGKNFNVEVDWYYSEGDEKMLEDGEDISDAIGIDFTYYNF